MTPTSGEADGIRLIRSISLIARVLDLLRHAGRLDLLAQLVDLGLLRVVLAQLALDGLQLLAEDVLALGLVHLGLDLGLDLALELEDLDLAGEEAGDELEALDRRRSSRGAPGAARWSCRGCRRPCRRGGPGSVMLRAATAASGGTGAPLATYCSIWAWTVRIERLDLDARWAWRRGAPRRARRGAATCWAKPWTRMPALALDDGPDGAVLELDDLGDLGEGADGVQLGRVGDVLLLRPGAGSRARSGRRSRRPRSGPRRSSRGRPGAGRSSPGR